MGDFPSWVLVYRKAIHSVTSHSIEETHIPTINTEIAKHGPFRIVVFFQQMTFANHTRNTYTCALSPESERKTL